MLKYILILCTAFAISFQASAQNTTEEWMSLTTDGFSIQYPNDWTPDQSGLMGSKLALFSPQASTEDQFKENVNVMTQDMGNNSLTLEQYSNLSEEQLKTMITNCIVIENKTITKAGKEFQRIIYTGTFGLFDLRFEQFYFIQKNMAYVVTFTCERSQYDTYKETGRKILHSFALTN